MKRIWKILIIVLVLAAIVAYFAAPIYQHLWPVFKLLTSPINDANDYYQIEVYEGDVIDYTCFLHPEGKYQVLETIDVKTREQIARYMKDNNLKLALGTHEFNYVYGTFESLIEKDFKFTKISDEFQ